MTKILVSLLLGAVVLSSQEPPLRILVLSGEDAVNIIQQKTATAPLVEVRDRNNLPVAGATVTFTIAGSGGASFAGGAQALTVVTNAAGQAAATGLTPLASGALNLQVAAALQNQAAALITITQTNVLTAAEAATAASTAASTSSTAGAGGGGSGISGTTIGVSAAAVGAAVVGVAAASGGDQPATPIAAVTPTPAPTPTVTVTPPAPPAPTTTTYSGAMSYPFTYVVEETNCIFEGLFTCTYLESHSGTLRLTLTRASNDTVTGPAQFVGTMTSVSVSCGRPGTSTLPISWQQEIGGSTGSFGFDQMYYEDRLRFSGSLIGSTITGTFSIDQNTTETFGRCVRHDVAHGTANVTLQRQ